MRLFFLAAALLPGLFWEQSVATAPALRHAAIERLYVPAGMQAEWKQAGFAALALDPKALIGFQKLPAPGVQYRMNVASATRIPWIDSNGWRFERGGGKAYFYDVPQGAAALACAEAAAYDADAVVRIDPADLEAFGRMLAFIRHTKRPPLPARANIAMIDDGSTATGEVMNLLARHNLLFRAVSSSNGNYDITVQAGSREYAQSDFNNASELVRKIRQRLTDDKRLLRIYGSDVVIGRLTGDASRTRLNLLNYSKRKIYGVRVRLLGTYVLSNIASDGIEDVAALDFETRDGATEFTIPEMNTYSIVDLEHCRTGISGCP